MRAIGQLTRDIHQVPPVVAPTSNDSKASVKVATVPMSPHVTCQCPDDDVMTVR